MYKNIPGIFPLHSYSCYIHSVMHLCVCSTPLFPDKSVCLFVCVCVCHSSYDWMHVGAQSQRNLVINEPPIFQLLQGQPERKQNGWVTLSQHPANAAPLHHSSLELNSVAKTNKESNYYCWNLYWPSPAILPKGNTTDWNVHFRNERKENKKGFYTV